MATKCQFLRVYVCVLFFQLGEKKWRFSIIIFILYVRLLRLNTEKEENLHERTNCNSEKGKCLSLRIVSIGRNSLKGKQGNGINFAACKPLQKLFFIFIFN